MTSEEPTSVVGFPFSSRDSTAAWASTPVSYTHLLATTFNRMLERLEQSFDSQKMFVSNVSHELRTPMAALIAELELADVYKRQIFSVNLPSRGALLSAITIE